MDYIKAMAGRGINLNSLSDYALELLEHAIEQEKNRRDAEREREEHMRLIAEYTDKLNEFIAELNDDGFILDYDEYKDEFFINESE